MLFIINILLLQSDLESLLFLISINVNVHSKTTDSNKLAPLLLAVQVLLYLFDSNFDGKNISFFFRYVHSIFCFPPLITPFHGDIFCEPIMTVAHLLENVFTHA